MAVVRREGVRGLTPGSGLVFVLRRSELAETMGRLVWDKRAAICVSRKVSRSNQDSLWLDCQLCIVADIEIALRCVSNDRKVLLAKSAFSLRSLH